MVLTRSNYIDLSRSFNKWKSRTDLSRNKSQFSEMVSENLPMGVTKNTIKFSVNPPLKGMLKGSIEYRDYYNYEQSWQAGTKVFFNICNIGTKAQWITEAFWPNMANESSQNWFSLSPSQGQPAGSFVPANTTPNSQKMGVSTADVKLDFINLSSNVCRLKISWYRVSEETNETVLARYNSQVTQQTLFTTNFAVNTPVVDEPTTGGNETVLGYSIGNVNAPASLQTMPYISLQSRRDVTENFKLLKTTSFVLAAGDIHTLNNYIDLNIFQKKELVSQGPVYPTGSIQCILECQGLATHIVVPSAAGPPVQRAVNEINLGGGRIGVMISRHLNLKSMKITAEKNDVTYIGRGNNTVYGNISQSVEPKSSIVVQNTAGTETA